MTAYITSKIKMVETENSSDSASKYMSIEKKIKERVGKRLAYILRYGALKQGLVVLDGGFVKFNDLLNMPLFKRYDDLKYIMEEIESSLSYRNVNRFEMKKINGEMYVRATYGRKFERSKYHSGGNVTRLLDLTLDYVADHVEDYDFDGFPDEFLINELIHRLKRNKKLNAKTLESLISAGLEFLDFDGVFLNERIIKTIYKKCLCLKIISFKDCGYFLIDHYLELILKNCKSIESLNLSYCKDLTDRSLYNICKYIPNTITNLYLAGNSNYTEDAIINLVNKCTNLKQLDIYDNKNITETGMNTLVSIVLNKSSNNYVEFKIIHKLFNDNCLASKVPYFQ